MSNHRKFGYGSTVRFAYRRLYRDLNSRGEGEIWSFGI